MPASIIRLHPFGDERAADLDIACTVHRQSSVLRIDFIMEGELTVVTLPPSVERPMRLHRLWESTCLECFVAVKESPAYWEFNLSPAGNWNVYRFDDYRQGMREEPAVSDLCLEVKRQQNQLCLGWTVDLAGLGLDRQTILLGLAAVVGSRDRGNAHWAAVHTSTRPDFHRRDGFIVELPHRDGSHDRSR